MHLNHTKFTVSSTASTHHTTWILISSTSPIVPHVHFLCVEIRTDLSVTTSLSLTWANTVLSLLALKSIVGVNIMSNIQPVQETETLPAPWLLFYISPWPLTSLWRQASNKNLRKCHHIILKKIKLAQASLRLIAYCTSYWWQWFTLNPFQYLRTYRWARPALRTAEEMALMAVSMALMSWVSSPVAPLAWRPVSMTNRVRVHTSVSNADWSDMLGSGLSVSVAEQQTACSPVGGHTASERPHYQPSPFHT